MNIAIIGCGNIAAVHARAIKSLGHNIVLAVNNNIAGAKAFAKLWNIEDYTDNFELALKENVDVIHICTPPSLHYNMVKTAIQNKKHIVCEKPLCINLGQASELFELANNSNTVFAINYNNRFYGTITKAKSEMNGIGQVKLLHGHYLQEFHCLPSEYSWRYIESLAGNMRAVTEIASHWFDIARYLTGLEFVELSASFVYANKTRYLKNGLMYQYHIENSEEIIVSSEDAASITFKLSNGACGNLIVSEISQGHINDLKIEINGSDKSLAWACENPYSLLIGEKNKGTRTYTNSFSDGFNESFANFFSDVYSCIQNRSSKSIFANIRDAYVNVLICDAVYKSAKNNSEWVKIEY